MLAKNPDERPPLPWALALSILVAGGLWLAWLTPSGMPNGDAAVYAQQVLQGDFESRPVHFGYYRVAALLLAPWPDAPDRAFNLLSALFGGATLGLVYLLAFLACRRRDAALAAPAALAGNLIFVENGALAEVYALQALLAVLAWLFWVRGRTMVAGAALGMGVLVTPTTVLAAAGWPWLRRERRPFLWALLAAAAMFAFAIGGRAHEYFLGERGVLKAAGAAMPVEQLVAKEGFELLAGFLAFLPLFELGAWRAFREARPWLAALATTWLATVALAEKFRDVPAQLPTWTLCAILAAWGWQELEERLAGEKAARWWWGACAAALLPVLLLFLLVGKVGRLGFLPAWQIAASALALLAAYLLGWRRRASAPRVALAAVVVTSLLVGMGVSARVMERERARIEGYRAAVRVFAQLARPDSLVVASWEKGILLEHYLARKSYTERWLNAAWLDGGGDEGENALAAQRWQEALQDGREIWLIDQPKWSAAARDAGYVIERPFEMSGRSPVARAVFERARRPAASPAGAGEAPPQ